MRTLLPRIYARVFVGALAIAFLPSQWLFGAPKYPTRQGTQFPSIEATSLSKVKYRLPQGFAGELNLVVISFAREQQHVVDTWIPVAREIASAHSNFSYYELPVMSEEILLYRWWLNASLRNTTDPDLRSRTLTAYVNKHKFLKTLGIANDKKVTALLVDKTGKIYWQADGACTGEERLSILSILAANGI